MKIKIKLVAIVLILCSTGFLYSSTYIINEQDIAVITEFGKPIKTVTEAGLHYKGWKLMQTVNKFDRRINLFDTQPIQLLLEDKNPIIISCFVAWYIQNPLLFFQSVGNEKNAKVKLSDMLTSKLGITLGNYNRNNLFNIDPEKVQLAEIEQKLKKYTSDNALKNYGINVDYVGIQRLSYPSTIIKSVHDRMKSERAKEAAKIRAEGQEQADMIIAAADKKAREISAMANKEALIIRGEGDGDAMKIYSKAFQEDTEFFDFTKSLETYKKIFGRNTTLILSTDSELLKYFNIKGSPKNNNKNKE